ncbi:hypothetical protein POVCU1_060280 [Plasmodium ovale curtisi]|uniref:PIR Superfamily Protein n=1 Tax=Plasmodium ovale curtisi TaxID=864141 RepID=A0A1A8X798_PLAOA|nr:hypothetical protein POVCU1_060280 [Plasmodium ovale curtisi]
MTNDINKENLPSIKYYNVLKYSIHYKEIYDIINKIEPDSKAHAWITYFNDYSYDYLDKYPIYSVNNNPNKRCRDYIYTLEFIKKRIKGSTLFDGQNDIMLSNIDNFVKSLISQGQNESVRETYDHSSSEYSDILKYYNYNSFTDIESIIEKIKCNNHHGAASEETPQSPGEHTPILLVLPLLGIILISFFLYKVKNKFFIKNVKLTSFNS